MRCSLRNRKYSSSGVSDFKTHDLQGVPPASVAEWTLGQNGAPDYYDVSLVDGASIPISVVPSAASCGTASCLVDLNANCPAELQSKDASGTVVGCKSACLANLDGNQGKGIMIAA